MLNIKTLMLSKEIIKDVLSKSFNFEPRYLFPNFKNIKSSKSSDIDLFSHVEKTFDILKDVI